MTCPICSTKSAPQFKPFCSQRCADVDLGNWLTGKYAIPTEDTIDTDREDTAFAESETKLH